MLSELIEVFVLTYNRAVLMERSVRSVLKQTVPVKLTIIDNCSVDDTASVVARLQAESNAITYVRRDQNGGWPGNFETAKKYFSRPYVLIFSDDDLLHPQYIEIAQKLIQDDPSIDLVASGNLEFTTDDNLLTGSRYNKVPIRKIRGRSAFAAYTFISQVLRPLNTPSFPNIIYRRSYLDRAQALDKYFGKIADRPFIVEGVCSGCAAVIELPLLYYRIHMGSDTNNHTNACTIDQLRNIMLFYKKLMNGCEDLASMYWLVAGRNLKAFSNFANTGKSLARLLYYALVHHLIGVVSFPVLLERGLHLFGFKGTALFERVLLSKIRQISSEEVVSV